MTRLRVNTFSIAIDGFGAGPAQDPTNPLGIGGMALHDWMFGSHRDAVDDMFIARGSENVGAWIIGRNMFGPVRGPWPDERWRGCWGDDPPFHVPVFVLTHHARAPITMDGGTTFHFVTDGIEAAHARAQHAAAGKDVRVGGGVATIRQYLTAGLVDELHLALVPTLLGRGEQLFADLDLVRLGYTCTEHTPSATATHVVLTKA